MRIGIVGAGISGLTVAYRLCDRHEVTVFEAGNSVGGHTNTIDVDLGDERYPIDTGFIVFNHRTYPNFTRLLAELKVESQPTSMSFSLRCDRSGLEYSGTGLNGLFAQRRNLFNPRFHRLLRDVFRFNRRAVELLNSADRSLTVGQYFARERYSREFIEQYFLPMASAVWSSPRGTIKDFPIRFIVEFYRNHGLLSINDRPQWRVICGGSKQYVAAMTRRFADSIHIRCPVESVVRRNDCVEVRTDRSSRLFDHVIFACHSDQGLRILGDDATPTEQELLSAFPYERNVALLHTDTSVLPRCRRAWASWNYLVPRDDPGKATVTYNMNILQRLQSRHVFCVTLNGEESVDPGRVIRRIVYHHPIFTIERSAAQRRHSEVINRNRTSFCGAYWGNGFHEDGVNSAFAVCQALERESCKAASTKAGCDTGDSSRLATAFATASS